MSDKGLDEDLDEGASSPSLDDEIVGSLRDLAGSAERLVSSISGGLEDAEGRVREGLDQAEETIRNHPLAALGIAAGLGFVIGLMIGSGGDE